MSTLNKIPKWKKYYLKNRDKELLRGKLKREREKLLFPDAQNARNRRLSKLPRGIWNSYKKNSRVRGISFELTFEEFNQYLNKPCFYCGEESKGVDRMDNSIGYITGNVCACCKWCNIAKNNLSADEFIRKCKLVAQQDVQYGGE